MRQKKFDYKNYKRKQGISRVSRIDKKKPLIRGIIFIFFIFTAITVLLYYSINNPKTVQEPLSSTSISSATSHFIIINVDNPRDNKLVSVVMLGYNKSTGKLILSYFPPEVSLKQKPLSTDYSEKQENGLLGQFESFFNKKFYYLVLYNNFYEQLSRRLKRVIIHSEVNKEVTIHGSILEKYDSNLEKYDNNNNFFLIQGYALLKYMKFNEPKGSIKIKHDRVLYSLLRLLSNGNELVKVINSSFSKAIYRSNVPLDKKEFFLDLLSKIRGIDIYSYIFSFNSKQGTLPSIEDSTKDYFKFINSPTLYTKAFNKVRVKVIDSSGLGHLDGFIRSGRKNFLVKVLNVDVRYYGIGSNVISESYIVNLSGNLAMANYLKGPLKIKHIYNSANKLDQYYDILLVIGKDFPMGPLNK